MGSVERALKINNKPFDKLIFVEKDPSMCSRLKKLSDEESLQEY